MGIFYLELDMFKTVKPFKSLKPPPSSSPASRGRKEVGD